MKLAEGKFRPSAKFWLIPVSVNDSPTVGRDINAAEQIRVARDHIARVVPLVVVVVDRFVGRPL
jgi:hypothetical protein